MNVQRAAPQAAGALLESLDSHGEVRRCPLSRFVTSADLGRAGLASRAAREGVRFEFLLRRCPWQRTWPPDEAGLRRIAGWFGDPLQKDRFGCWFAALGSRDASQRALFRAVRENREVAVYLLLNDRRPGLHANPFVEEGAFGAALPAPSSFAGQHWDAFDVALDRGHADVLLALLNGSRDPRDKERFCDIVVQDVAEQMPGVLLRFLAGSSDDHPFRVSVAQLLLQKEANRADGNAASRKKSIALLESVCVVAALCRWDRDSSGPLLFRAAALGLSRGALALAQSPSVSLQQVAQAARAAGQHKHLQLQERLLCRAQALAGDSLQVKAAKKSYTR